MNRKQYGLLVANLATHTFLKNPEDIVKVADKIVYHQRRVLTLTDEKAIERVLNKLWKITGLPWDCDNDNGNRLFTSFNL